MKIGLYLRVSTVNQKNNTSLSYQKTLGIDFCKRSNYEYEIFEDIESGGKYNRLEFDKLKEKIKNRELTGIWVYDNDRLSRKMEVGIKISDLIVENDCRLFVGWEEKKIESSGGRFEYMIRSVMSDYERMRIKERMDFGKRKLLLDGGKLGNVGYGFKRDGKNVVLNIEEGKIVKDVFKIYNYKVVKTYGNVYDRLKKKYKKPILSISTIGRILRDKKYNGLYNGNLEGEKYQIEFDKIINDEIWKKTQLKIKKNKGSWRGNEKEYFELKGKVICSGCGNKMWVLKSNQYRYYCCNSKLKTIKEKRKDSKLKHECSSVNNLYNRININKLEKIIWNSLFQVLHNSEDVKKEYKKRYDNKLGSKERFKGKLIFLKEKKERISNEFMKKVEELIELGIDKGILERLNEKYKNDILEIGKEIEKITLEEEKREVKDSIGGYLELMKLDLSNDYNIIRDKDRVKLIDKYIESVTINRKGKESYSLLLNLYLKDIGKYESEKIEISERGIFYILKIKTTYIQFLIYKYFCFMIHIEISNNEIISVGLE